jgi:hypothetical protein
MMEAAGVGSLEACESCRRARRRRSKEDRERGTFASNSIDAREAATTRHVLQRTARDSTAGDRSRSWYRSLPLSRPHKERRMGVVANAR